MLRAGSSSPRVIDRTRGRVCRLHKELFRIPSRLFRLFLLSSSLSSRCGFPCRVRCLCHRITLFFTSLNTVATGFAEPVINSRGGPHNPDTAATLTYISTSLGPEICVENSPLFLSYKSWLPALSRFIQLLRSRNDWEPDGMPQLLMLHMITILLRHKTLVFVLELIWLLKSLLESSSSLGLPDQSNGLRDSAHMKPNFHHVSDLLKIIFFINNLFSVV